MNTSPILPLSSGYIIPSGEERRQSNALVTEVLERTGNALKVPAQTDREQSERRMLLANRAAALVIQSYYDSHPIATNLPELRKCVMSSYLSEFSQWSKEDCIELLTMQQTAMCLKHFGY